MAEFPAAPAKPCVLASRNPDGGFRSPSVPCYVPGPALFISLNYARLVLTSPATLPTPPAALTHFCRLHHPGVGLWLKRKRKKKKNQPVIWNLNETKFISLCCHFIFHRFDGEGTGDPRGPFCFAHRVERQEEKGGKGLMDRRRHSPPSHQNHGGKERTSPPRRPATRGRCRRLKTCAQVKKGLGLLQGRKGGAPSVPGSGTFSNTNRAGLRAS